MAPAPAEQGGYYTLRSGETWGLLRSCIYHDRPAQADMLHLDLWWRGRNIVGDPGTYSYSAASPWTNGLASTRVHNTVTVDRLDQMTRGPAFLWLGWARGRVVRRCVDARSGIRLIEAEHDGFAHRTGVRHRRAVLLVADGLWIVIDDVLGSGEHEIASQWLFPDARIDRCDGASYRLDHPAGTFAVRFDGFTRNDAHATPTVRCIEPSDDDPRGWVSDTYLSRRPAVALASSAVVQLPFRCVTSIALGAGAAIQNVAADGMLARMGERRFTTEWRPWPYTAETSVVRSMEIEPAGMSSGPMQLTERAEAATVRSCRSR